MRKYAVIGLGRFGSTLAKELAGYGADVIAVDTDETQVAKVREFVSAALRIDGTSERALKEHGIDKVDVVVVGMGKNFEATQLATVILKRLGVKRVVVKSSIPLHEAILTRIGADTLVSPEKESAVRLAHTLLAPRILDYIELAEGHSLVQLEAPEKFQGRTIRDLNVRKLYNVNIVAIKRRIETGTDEEGSPTFREELVDIPRPDYEIEPTDILVLIGEDKDIGRLAT